MSSTTPSSDLLYFLQKGLSKAQVEEIAKLIRADRKAMKQMVEYATMHEETIGMKASWIMGAASVQENNCAHAYLPQIIDRLGAIKTMGIKRELIKTMMFSNVMDCENLGTLVDTLFVFLRSTSEDISVSYNSMKLMNMIVKHIPELKEEFHNTLAHQMEYKSPTWRKCAQTILKKK
jgi:hypothetical protein